MTLHRTVSLGVQVISQTFGGKPPLFGKKQEPRPTQKLLTLQPSASINPLLTNPFPSSVSGNTRRNVASQCTEVARGRDLERRPLPPMTPKKKA